MFILTKTTLAELRKRAGYRSQQAFANALTFSFGRTVSDTTVSAWETCRWLPNLTPKETQALCRLLDCSLADLVEAFENNNEST